MTNFIIAMILQSMNLIHYDIYECTQPSVYKIVYFNNKPKIFPETNPVANVFFSKGDFNTPFILANVLNIGVSIVLSKIDPHYSSIYLAGLNIAEVLAISSWSLSKTNLKISALVYAVSF